MTLREVTIGRAKDCDIFLDARCQYASKRHATIYYDGMQLMFRDTSTNGTLINNVNVKQRAVPIRHGDSIMLAGQYPVSWQQIDMFFPPQERYQQAQMMVHPVAAPVVADQPKPTQPDTSKWSWGAFMLYPIWGFFNGCWWAFFISFFLGWTIIPSIIFGVYGYRWAWENRTWTSVESFEETQHSWDMWGIAIFVLNIFSVVLLLALYGTFIVALLSGL